MIIELSRHCEAVLIPSGEKTVLLKGDSVSIAQNLGGSITITTNTGQMARIDGKDVDALGMEQQSFTTIDDDDKPFSITKVWNRLSTVFDPEIPVNIVDLGLIYLCEAEKLESGKYQVTIEMTMTAPGCGMGDVLKQEAIDKIITIKDVHAVNISIVFEPQWDRSMMSDVAKLELGMM